MKKTLSLFLAALMIFTSLFAMSFNSFAAGNSISVVTDKTSYNVGDTATVQLVMNASKISALGIRLKYDAKIYEVKSASGIGAVNSANAGTVNIAWASGSDTDFNSQVILTVTFEVKSATPTDLILEFYNDRAIGSNNEDISSTFTLNSKTLYPDTPATEWYYPAVKFVSQQGYFHGYGNGNFGPGNNIQRQDFVVVLSKIAGVDLSAYAGQNGGFADVPTNDYYSAAVAWAKANHILSGYANGKFGVGDPITREQACLIFYNFCEGEVVGDVSEILADYPDGKNVSDWARTGVAWAAENYVVGGNGKLNPAGNANRAEMAQIITNMSSSGIL